MKFKDFLLNENKHYLSQRIGDILNALQDLQQNGKSMGTRQLAVHTEVIVNQIRKILHGKTGKEELKYLKTLQKIGVALMKSLEEKNDLQSVIASSVSELEKLSSDLGLPVNSIGTKEPEKQAINSPSDSEF